MAQRMRQIGLDRIYHGSDGAFAGHPDPEASWEAFRKNVPLTDAEFARVAANVAPYWRDRGIRAVAVRAGPDGDAFAF